MVEIAARIHKLVVERGYSNARFLREAGLAHSLINALYTGRYVGELLLVAICTRCRVAPRWVLTGDECSKELQDTDWPLSGSLPSDLRWMVAKNSRAKTPAPSSEKSLLWEAPCCICRGRVQRYSKSAPHNRIYAKGVVPKYPCCGRPSCRKALKNKRWNTSFNRKAEQLGYVPCRGCWEAEPLPGSIHCKRCKEKERTRRVNRQEDKVASGVCKVSGCNNPLKPDDFLCHMHREIATENRIAYINTWRGEKLWGPRPEVISRNRMLHMEKCRGLGTCYRCGKAAVNPDARWPMCERHRRITNSQSRCRDLRKKHWTRISIRTLLLKVRLPVP